MIRFCSAIILLAMVFASTAKAETYWLPENGGSVIGKIQGLEVAHEDTLIDLGRRFNIGFEELRLANPTVDPWVPGAGTLVVMPSRFVLPNAPRKGIVLNVAEMRIYYYPPALKGQRRKVITHPVSIGRQDWKTPLGRTRISAKVRDPAWHPPASIIAEHAAQGRALPSYVPPGPNNPLGRYALRLGLPGYLIHGTNKPVGIGMRVSHGCVRMYPEDIAKLFHKIPVGTPVHIVDQPVKVGWRDGAVYLEVHPTTGEFDRGGKPSLDATVRIVKTNVTPEEAHYVSWQRVANAVETITGIPYAIAGVDPLGQ